LLTIAQARRIAIAATGLGAPRPAGRVTTRHLRKVVQQVGVVQLDSVNAVARAHELLFFSRLGPFDKRVLDDLVYRKRELYEGWLHVASLIPTELWPLLTTRRWSSLQRNRGDWHVKNAKVLDQVRTMLREQGPLGSADVNHIGPAKGQWRTWSAGKYAIEWLFMAGEVGVTARRGAFERVYDLIEHVLPEDVLAAPHVADEDARDVLVGRAAHHLGIGTEADIADYYRMLRAPAKAAIARLVERGEVEIVTVEGWKDKAYVPAGPTIPRRGCPDGRLVSPFDPLVWFRPRDVRLFDFDYTIEIYTPEPKRKYGYYVLPFLQGDAIVGRVDVRSDRNASVLRVPGAYAEDAAIVDVDGLAAELRLLAQWQGCADIVVGDKGDLAKPLRKACA
jgi:uncharacterized protein YcaQ